MKKNTSGYLAMLVAMGMLANMIGCGTAAGSVDADSIAAQTAVETLAETANGDSAEDDEEKASDTAGEQAAGADNAAAEESYAAADATADTKSASTGAGNTDGQGDVSAGAENSDGQSDVSAASGNTAAAVTPGPSKEDIETTDTISNTSDGEHAITADGETAEYTNLQVTKSGDSEGDEADFYGENAAIFATNGASLTLSDLVVETDGTHANGVFSYGEGTTVTISDSVIETSGNCSGGLMTTGGGTMNAGNLTIHTTGNSSAAIRSDRGGGTVNVTGGTYTTDGTGSPVIYSTADITVSNAEMTSTASQGVVVEGKNSVTLNNVILNADNNTKNSDKSDTYQAVMIYQSMSGDAAEGAASFTMNGGTLTNANGDIFFVNNTVATISLSGAEIINRDENGVFLRAEAAGWGSEGSNGGQVTLNASAQTIDGDMIVDEVSNLNLYLTDGSAFTGAINAAGAAGEVYVELDADSTWTLTADSYISSLTCDEDSVVLNGHTLYVNGEAYTEGTASSGEAIGITVTSGGGNQMGTPPEGAPGDGSQTGTPPSGKPGDGSQMGTPPSGKPGDGSQMGTPPSGKPGDGSQMGTPPDKKPDADSESKSTDSEA